MFFLLAVTLPSNAVAQSEDELTRTDPVIEPQLERTAPKLPRVDTEDFEIGIFAGLMSIEDFGTNPLYGLSLAYHVTEDIFFEATSAKTSAQDTSFRQIGLPVFPSEEEDLSFYDFNLGYNILPGELFFGSRTAVTTALYVLGGIGNTRFLNEDRDTLTFGVGVRLLINDWAAVRIDMRNHVFDTDILGNRKSTNNTDFHLGLTAFF
jgi:outer membrane beta-barrel protein